MKAIKLFMAIASMLVAGVACGQNKEAVKTLVVYYSQTSNTKTVAQEMATRLGADLKEIVPVKPYNGDFQATISRSTQSTFSGSSKLISFFCPAVLRRNIRISFSMQREA